MKSQIESFLESVQQVETLEEFQSATEDLCDILNLEHVVYHWVNSVGERFGAGTYSSEWVDRYLEKDYLRMDPVIFGCFQRFTPVNWKQLDWSSKAAKAFFLEAIEYGVGNQGYTIPIRGPKGQFALFTVNNTSSDADWDQFVDTFGRDLIIVAHEFNKKALEFEASDKVASTPALSPREAMAISYLAKGLSRAQAAQEMGISEHTLRVYIEAARHKLGALNTTHAVARALSTGVIIV
ncbi:DNA-binding CsgD family transcriptional regulator [Pacificibacter maritimus]|uniref:DNA-binding CsgD family transcriptional regulator n=1 Tax=Pacificibacter maritimus TaxID=762213 RepID=A0A3N4UJ39_9RHOB|nr:LuxR family transcriptional regulator [Pacificibacter maritimus]RPE67289.1 DNA-binding CsgD family transcriptional regulator [Pacificibacter maritimus]